jgi:hypothetical protein
LQVGLQPGCGAESEVAAGLKPDLQEPQTANKNAGNCRRFCFQC